MITRAQIYTACFNQMQAMPVFIPGATKNPEFSRRFKHWSQVPINLMPCCFMQQYEETADQSQAMGLTRWHSIVNVWFYYNAQNYNALPDDTFNSVLDSLEAAFKPPTPNGLQTLGGTVTHAWVEGKVLYSDGALDHKAVIVAQIHLLWGGQ